MNYLVRLIFKFHYFAVSLSKHISPLLNHHVSHIYVTVKVLHYMCLLHITDCILSQHCREVFGTEIDSSFCVYDITWWYISSRSCDKVPHILYEVNSTLMRWKLVGWLEDYSSVCIKAVNQLWKYRNYQLQRNEVACSCLPGHQCHSDGLSEIKRVCSRKPVLRNIYAKKLMFTPGILTIYK